MNDRTTESALRGTIDRKSLLEHAWLDRDLGWLAFNERVLHEALDERTPLLERLKFLAIVTSNLDEFFMKRVGTLRGKALLEDHEDPLVHAREMRARVCCAIRAIVCEDARAIRQLATTASAASARRARHPRLRRGNS